jgi:hypothetical protein
MSTARRHDLAVDAAAPRPVITASRDERNVVSSSMTSRVIQPNIAAIIRVCVPVEHDHLADVRRNLHSTRRVQNPIKRRQARLLQQLKRVRTQPNDHMNAT